MLSPYGSKAFFQGRLTPSCSTVNQNQHGDDAENDAGAGGYITAGGASAGGTEAAAAAASALMECVVVRLSDGTEQQMTRKEALDRLQQEMDECEQEMVKKSEAHHHQKAGVKTIPAAAIPGSSDSSASQRVALSASVPSSCWSSWRFISSCVSGFNISNVYRLSTPPP